MPNMTYKLEFSKTSQKEFDKIYQDYAETFSNEQSALKVIRSIQKSIRFVLLDPASALSFDARIGERIDRKYRIRFTISEQYLIFFILTNETVSIVHILSTRADYMNYLKLLFENFEKERITKEKNDC